ncbi:MAG TPA: M20 family metallo-hydrolase [Gemmatimonadaceae bacterium]|nr:M20 family metallo-hydrolase [Gemmatimonadaceae bacterium]
MHDGLRVSDERLLAQLHTLAAFGATAEGGVQRVAYSDADLEARACAMDLMRAAELDVRIDAAGNIIGRRAGEDAELPPLLFGSHVDSVPNGGNYDGPLGSLAAIEVARTLTEQGVRTRHPLEVVIFQNEEGGLVGSRAMRGDLCAADLDRVSVSGKTIGEGIVALGGDPTALTGVRRAPGSIAGYLELHIEQGSVLESARVDIGVVEGLVGIQHWEVTVTGVASHAGTTPMSGRRDALLAAARFIEAVHRVVTAMPGPQVGTVGQLAVLPGAANVIPGRARLTLELRDTDERKIHALHEQLVIAGREIAESTGTAIEFRQTNMNPPAPMDERVQRVIAECAARLGLSWMSMPSGAGHDAQNMAVLGPAGMIFVPSVGGISHAPAEFTTPADVTNGANVLLHAVLALSGG